MVTTKIEDLINYTKEDLAEIIIGQAKQIEELIEERDELKKLVRDYRTEVWM